MKDIAVSETVKKRIERNQKRVHKLDMLIRKIYEDNVIGRLPDRLFQSMLTDYENEQNELNKIIENDTADMQRSRLCSCGRLLCAGLEAAGGTPPYWYVGQMKQSEGVTETMKADNPMLWVQSMNSIRNRAEEIIRQEMIYC